MIHIDRSKLSLGVWWVTLMLISFSSAYSQQYKIGPEDELRITFWQQPGLDRTAKVSRDSTIILPVIGRLKAGGLTTSQLSEKIIYEFSLYPLGITNASVEVLAYESNRIYVTGHIRTPGKYTFEKIPDMWRVILEAGGPLETANLSNVIVIRAEQSGGRAFAVDLTKVLQKGDLSKLPELQPGDNINVSGIASGVAGRGVEALQNQDPNVYVYGEIARAGVYTYEEGFNILQVIINAGGPNIDSDMKRVKVIRRNPTKSTITQVNVKKYSEDPKVPFFLLEPGDLVYLPKKRSFGQAFFGSLFRRLAFTTASTLLSIYLYTRLRN